MKPTQKPTFVDPRGFGTEKEIKYLEKQNFTTGYYNKKK